jgi:hypothetical protein
VVSEKIGKNYEATVYDHMNRIIARGDEQDNRSAAVRSALYEARAREFFAEAK